MEIPVGKLSIIVKANAPKSEIISYDNNKYIVHVKAPPEKGKANLELIKLLSRETGRRVRIVSGFGSKRKIIEVE